MTEPTPDPWAADGVPRRDLADPRTLRALAHPLRLRLLDELVVRGQATASELAHRLDESAANCSWHLRQLAKHGLIEEAEGGAGRQRPWRYVRQSIGVTSPGEAGTELARAQDSFTEATMSMALRAWQDWARRRHADASAWREAAFTHLSSHIWLTPEELRRLRDELVQVQERHLAPHVGRIDPDRRPADSRPVYFVSWAVPHSASTESEGDGHAGD